MAIVAPIVVNNGAATPVATTFSPEAPDINNAYSFVDRSGGISSGFKRMTVSTKPARGAAKVNRATLSIDVPTMQMVNGVNTLAYISRAKLELLLPVDSTDAERKDLYAFLVNSLSNTLLRGALRDLDPVYG